MAETGIEIKMKPPHAGEFIRMEIVEELGLSVTEAAKILGVPGAALADLLNCKTGLAPEMAMRVELAFGVDMEMMLRMQAWWDVVAMRDRASEFDVQRYEPVETAA